MTVWLMKQQLFAQFKNLNYTCLLPEEVCHISLVKKGWKMNKKKLLIDSTCLWLLLPYSNLTLKKMLVQIWTLAQDSIPNQLLAVWMCLRLTDIISKHCFSCCHVYEYQMWLFIKDHSEWDYCVCLVSQSLGSLSTKMTCFLMHLYFIGLKYL